MDYKTYVSNRTNYLHIDDVHSYVQEFQRSGVKVIALDTETYYDEDLVNEWLADKTRPFPVTKWIKGSPNNRPFGVSMFYEVDGVREGVWVDHDLHALIPILEDATITKELHNAKYDQIMLGNIGINVKGKIIDTVAMIHLIDEDMECRTPEGKTKRSKALKDLGYHFLGSDAKDLETMVSKARSAIARSTGRKKNDVSYKEVGDLYPELMKDYAIFDTELVFDLVPLFSQSLTDEHLWGAFAIEMAASEAVIEAERTGVSVDVAQLLGDMAEIDKVLTEITMDIDRLLKTPYNLNSTADVVQAFADLGVLWEWKTDKGEDMVDKPTLEHLMRLHGDSVVTDFSNYLLEYRRATKLKSTYMEGILQYVQADGKVHCDFWLSPDDWGKGSARTGRISSSSPNYQNQPKEPTTLRGREFNIRGYVIADEDYQLVSMDAKQQEYRVLAHYAMDSAFMDLVRQGYDVHVVTASKMFGIPPEEVTDAQRNKGKRVNFATVYGLSNLALANSLGHDIDEERVRMGTKYLYRKFKVWEMPPYAGATVTREQMYAGVIDPEILDGIDYFLSEKVQTALQEAMELKKSFFEPFPAIKDFIKQCTRTAEQRGYIVMWGGRRKHFKRASDAYKGPNALIQGTCAMVMKAKLYEVYTYLRKGEYRSKLVLTIHDEIILHVHKDEHNIIAPIKEILGDLDFRVPIDWDVDIGKSWGKLTKLPTLGGGV